MKSITRLRYVERVRQEVERSQRCVARHIGRTVLQRRAGDARNGRQAVELYELEGHGQALRCFAWTEPAANEYCRERFVCILDLPPSQPHRD